MKFYCRQAAGKSFTYNLFPRIKIAAYIYNIYRTTAMNMKPIHILHVEDSEGDILLIHEAIKEGSLAHKIDVVRNGEEALQFLNKSDQHSDKATPDLILLDL